MKRVVVETDRGCDNRFGSGNMTIVGCRIWSQALSAQLANTPMRVGCMAHHAIL